MTEPENVIDVAIIGAGVSGAYSAYRLTQDTGKTVAIFEANTRIGGRLWSHHWPQADTMVELGGEGFSPIHANVFGLTVNELGLDVIPHGPFNTLDRMFLRNRMIHYPDFLDRNSFPVAGRPADETKVRYFVKDGYFQPGQPAGPETAAPNGDGPKSDPIADPFETIANHLINKYSPEVGEAFGALMTAFSSRVSDLMAEPEAKQNGGRLTASQAARVMSPDVYRALGEIIEAIEQSTFSNSALTQSITGEDRSPAYDLNFWSIVVNDLGREAYELFRNAGYDNTSALDFNLVELTQNLLIGSLMGIASPNFWGLEGGFDQLPKTLIKRAQDKGAALHMGQYLTDVIRDQETGLIALTFVGGDGTTTIQHARKMIMSAPISGFDHGIALRGFDTDLAAQFARERQSIVAIPASKLYLVYPRPWWTDMPDLEPGSDGLEGFASTDLPPRAIYYKGYCTDGKRGIMTGALTDCEDTGFWTGFLSPNAEMFPGTSEDVTERHAFGAPVHMVGACQGFLKQIHEDTLGAALPDPELALYHEWRSHGGGWSIWKSGRNIHDVAARLRRPFTADGVDQGLYCCGDSVAERHGWVENTIQSAELMLREAFGLDTARWLPGDEVF